MRRFAGYVALAVILFTLQTSLVRAGPPIGLHPGLVLLFVLAVGMRQGETAGAASGVVLGFLEDTFSAGLPGANILTKGLLGFFAGSVQEQLDLDNPNTQAIVAALATIVEGLVHLALLEVFSQGRGLIDPFFGTIVPAAAVNGALLPTAAFLSGVFRRRRVRRLASVGD